MELLLLQLLLLELNYLVLLLLILNLLLLVVLLNNHSGLERSQWLRVGLLLLLLRWLIIALSLSFPAALHSPSTTPTPKPIAVLLAQVVEYRRFRVLVVVRALVAEYGRAVHLSPARRRPAQGGVRLQAVRTVQEKLWFATRGGDSGSPRGFLRWFSRGLTAHHQPRELLFQSRNCSLERFGRIFSDSPRSPGDPCALLLLLLAACSLRRRCAQLPSASATPATTTRDRDRGCVCGRCRPHCSLCRSSVCCPWELWLT